MVVNGVIKKGTNNPGSNFGIVYLSECYGAFRLCYS